VPDFPFKTLTRYRAKKTFKSERSNDTFSKDKLYVYLSSTLNHYEDIEICIFKDIETGKDLTLHADQSLLSSFNGLFEVVKW
jgi:hypothetical protein